MTHEFEIPVYLPGALQEGGGVDSREVIGTGTLDGDIMTVTLKEGNRFKDFLHSGMAYVGMSIYHKAGINPDTLTKEDTDD